MENHWSLEDYHSRVERFVVENNILSGTRETNKKEIWNGLWENLLSSSPIHCIIWGIYTFFPNLKLLSNWEMLFLYTFLMEKGFDKEDMLNLYNYLFNQFRIYRAIEYPEYVDPNDKYFSPINIQGGFCRAIPNAR